MRVADASGRWTFPLRSRQRLFTIADVDLLEDALFAQTSFYQECRRGLPEGLTGARAELNHVNGMQQTDYILSLHPSRRPRARNEAWLKESRAACRDAKVLARSARDGCTTAHLQELVLAGDPIGERAR